MPTYDVFPLHPRVSPAQLAAYQKLRLASLETDPRAFASTYGHEAAFTEDAWREWLDAPCQQTMVASVVDAECEEKSEDKLEETGERWIGTMTIMGPSGLVSPPLKVRMDKFREARAGADWKIYALGSLWVHPAYRGKGIGARLVKECIGWAHEHADPKFPWENNNDAEKAVFLIVKGENPAALGLYIKSGFAQLEGLSESEEETWMWMKI